MNMYMKKKIKTFFNIFVYKKVHAHETIIIKAPINVNSMIRKDFSRTFYIRDQICTFIQENDGLYPEYIFIKTQSYIYVYPGPLRSVKQPGKAKTAQFLQK